MDPHVSLDSPLRPPDGPAEGAAPRHDRRLPLLLTKLQRPPVPPDGVRRPRLLKTLARMSDHPLTLLSAPTGYGKSTLVAQGLAETDLPAVWLSVDEYDNDLLLFLDYLIAALQTQFPDACRQTQQLLHAVQSPPVAYLAVSLVNELQAIATPYIVVLDDFHRLTDSAIRDLFVTLLRALPSQLRLVIVTQADPPWPLASLAGRGQLLEIRAADLRFHLDEAQAFLERVAGATLPAALVATLVEQTEGWIVAMRLAALTLASERDLAEALGALVAHDDRLGTGFLVQELLARQSPAIREVLLRTSVLDRLNAPLAEALMRPLGGEATESPTAQNIGAWLRHANLFLIPLDETGEWYRYHHLFQHLVRRELSVAWDAERIKRLHRRASDWYVQHDYVEEAVRHALAAGDPGRAADIMEPYIHQLFGREDWRGADRWLRLLPDDLVRQRPVLVLAQAWVLTFRFENQAILPLTAAAEAIVADPISPLSETERTSVRAHSAALQAYVSLWPTGQIQACLARAQEAVASLPWDHAYARGIALLYEGLALYATGQRTEAIQFLKRVIDAPDEPASVKVRALLGLSGLYRMQGPLFELEHTIQLYLKIADDNNLPLSSMWAHCLLGSLLYERNEVDQAVDQLELVAGHLYLAHFLSGRESLIELALAYQAQGRTSEARDTVQRLAQFCLERNGESQAESLSIQVRLALARQAVDEALRGAVQLFGIMPRVAMIYSEVPAITRAQALLASGGATERREALDLLAALEATADATHTLRPLVRILALQAVGLAAEGQNSEALARLERAARLAEPMGLIRTWVDVGPALAPLLGRVLERGVAPAYLRQVLAAFAAEQHATRLTHMVEYQGQLIEPLTDREIEIVGLLAEQLSTQEIADRLVISPLTVKRHISNIIHKLGVQNRREVAHRARAIGLLPPR